MGREYPSNPDVFCQRVHNAFMKNKLENDPVKVEELIGRGTKNGPDSSVKIT
jgi:hypothetical protein